MVKAVLDLTEQGVVLMSYELPKGDTTIGRLRDNSISIADTGVSRRHAAVHHTPEGYSISDLGAVNGVRVNGEKVDRALLNHGDTILLGNATLVFQLQTVVEEPDEKSPDMEKEPQEPGTDEGRFLKSETAVVASEHSDADGLQAQLEMLDRDNLIFMLKLRGPVNDTTHDKLQRVFDSLFAAGGVDVIVSMRETTEISAQGWEIIRKNGATAREDDKSVLIAFCRRSLIGSLGDPSSEEDLAFVEDVPNGLRLLQSRYESRKKTNDRAAAAPRKPPQEDARNTSLITLPPDLADQVSRKSNSVEDEIREIVRDYPHLSTNDLRKILSQPKHGAHRLGFFKMKGCLKRMGLDTLRKRIEYASKEDAART